MVGFRIRKRRLPRKLEGMWQRRTKHWCCISEDERRTFYLYSWGENSSDKRSQVVWHWTLINQKDKMEVIRHSNTVQ